MRLTGVTTESRRQVDLINVAFEARKRDFPVGTADEEVTRNLYVDLATTVRRKPWSAKFRTLRSRSHVYSYTFDRCLNGSDQLLLLCWPHRAMDGMSEVARAEMAESGIILPLVVLIELMMWRNPFGEWNEGVVTFS